MPDNSIDTGTMSAIFTGTMSVKAVRGALATAEGHAMARALDKAHQCLDSVGGAGQLPMLFAKGIADARLAIDEAVRAHANHLALTEEAKK